MTLNNSGETLSFFKKPTVFGIVWKIDRTYALTPPQPSPHTGRESFPPSRAGG